MIRPDARRDRNGMTAAGRRMMLRQSNF